MLCPVCKADIEPSSRNCELCRVALTFDGQRLAPHFPLIRPGELVDVRDFARDPPPGRSGRFVDIGTIKVKGNADGIVVELPAGKTIGFMEDAVRIRDACLRVVGVALDPDISFGASMRREILEEARTSYTLEVWPARRSVQVARLMTSPQHGGITPFLPWTQFAAVAPVGAWNVVDFRVQGPTLQAWVNDQPIITIHDPVLGIGGAAAMTSSEGQAGRAFLKAYELRLVGR